MVLCLCAPVAQCRKHESIEHLTDVMHKIAMNATYPQTCDKFSKMGYSLMYGMFLLPMVRRYHSENRKLRFFEVGLGCNKVQMHDKKGVDVWKAVFGPEDDLYLAEYNEACVAAMKEKGSMPEGINVVVGDQQDKDTLRRWISESGGGYDIFIDDGGHKTLQIYNTFEIMWPEVLPGGLYFIEDLQVARHPMWENSGGEIIMSEVIRDWTEQLMIPGYKNSKYKLPPKVKFIFCQANACVIGKCGVNDVAKCLG